MTWLTPRKKIYICWIGMFLIKAIKNQVIKVIKKLSCERLVSFWRSGALAHKCELEIFDQSQQCSVGNLSQSIFHVGILHSIPF